ncbi:MAG: DNA polymerase III subunit gamma/tau [Candidatus Schekmanbacteria bacterium]|nr:DNA polymerase III subunit gamma/tau [Candidatus Schekmanbacteria bacterium]
MDISEKSYLVLARKKRPQKFADVVGQEHITNTIKNALKSGRIAHAFLFSGTRGVGKTTCARILAKALNCDNGPAEEPCNVCPNCVSISAGNALDVIEIDGASNRRIGEIRELREKVGFSPTSSRFKVYIIDEVHMLTTEAFNALLKTLEEPPPHVKFILATTEPHKLPATILSRCQRYDFRTLSDDAIIAFLSKIAGEEKISIDEEGLKLLSRVAAGSVRDALSVFESIISFSEDKKITAAGVQEILGIVDTKFISDVVEAIIEGNATGIVKLSSELILRGYDVNFFCESLLQYLRDLMVISAEKGKTTSDLPGYERKLELSAKRNFDEWLMLFNLFFDCCKSVKRADNPSLILEVSLLKCMRAKFLIPLDDIIDKINKFSGSTGGGEFRSSAITTGASIGTSEHSALSKKTSDYPSPEQKDFSAKEVKEKTAASAYTSKGIKSGGENFEGRWNEFLKVLDEKSILLKSIFANGCRKTIDGKVLQVFLGDEFTLSMVRMGDNLNILKESVTESFGKDIELKVELEKDDENGSYKKETITSDEREALLKRAMKDEVVSEILELLPARITDVSLANK